MTGKGDFCRTCHSVFKGFPGLVVPQLLVGTRVFIYFLFFSVAGRQILQERKPDQCKYQIQILPQLNQQPVVIQKTGNRNYSVSRYLGFYSSATTVLPPPGTADQTLVPVPVAFPVWEVMNIWFGCSLCAGPEHLACRSISSQQSNEAGTVLSAFYG